MGIFIETPTFTTVRQAEKVEAAEASTIPTTKWFCSAVLRAGTPNHFESSIYSREKVWQSPNLFGSGIKIIHYE